MATVNSPIEEDDWELVNDDGFVYKRKKRPRLELNASAPPPPDPAVEESNRRERKRKALAKLKDKYQKELSQWEHLSNVLKDMQLKSRMLEQQREDHATTSSNQLVTSTPAPPTDPTCRRLIDELLSQAEAQEAIIQDVSNLCDVAEALCEAQEEKLKQSFTELPIWASSPRELITSLCEDLG